MGCNRHVNIRVANPHAVDQKRVSVNINVLVDPGKVYTALPRKILEELELKPIGKMDFLVQDSGVIQRDVGYALVSYKGCKGCKGSKAVVPVAFIEGEEKEPTLGATGLESLGLTFDATLNHLTNVMPSIPMLTEV